MFDAMKRIPATVILLHGWTTGLTVAVSFASIVAPVAHPIAMTAWMLVTVAEAFAFSAWCYWTGRSLHRSLLVFLAVPIAISSFAALVTFSPFAIATVTAVGISTTLGILCSLETQRKTQRDLPARSAPLSIFSTTPFANPKEPVSLRNEETPLDSPEHYETSSPNSLHSHSRRERGIEGESDIITGSAKVSFQPQQKTQLLHLSFVPAFAGIPSIEAEDIEAGIAEVEVAAVYSYGARLRVRRHDDLKMPVDTVIGYSACTPLNHAG